LPESCMSCGPAADGLSLVKRSGKNFRDGSSAKPPDGKNPRGNVPQPIPIFKRRGAAPAAPERREPASRSPERRCSSAPSIMIGHENEAAPGQPFDPNRDPKNGGEVIRCEAGSGRRTARTAHFAARPSKTYCFSTGVQGSHETPARRARRPSRVSSFSLARKIAQRARSHSFSETLHVRSAALGVMSGGLLPLELMMPVSVDISFAASPFSRARCRKILSIKLFPSPLGHGPQR